MLKEREVGSAEVVPTFIIEFASRKNEEWFHLCRVTTKDTYILWKPISKAAYILFLIWFDVVYESEYLL